MVTTIHESIQARRSAKKLVLPLTVFGVTFLLYTMYSCWQWNTFAVKSWDLAIFTQMYQGYNDWSAPIVSVKGKGYNLLGDHFHPLLVIFTPLFALFPTPFTLLISQNLCFSITAGVIAWAAQRHVGRNAGLLIGLACGLSWGLQYAVEAQFHEIALATPLIAWSLAAVLSKNWVWACVPAGLLPFVKEDLGLTVFVIGLLICGLGRRRLGISLAIWGLLWFVLATTVILPAVSGSGTWEYGNLIGNSTEQMGENLNYWHPQKTMTVMLLVAASAGLIFRSPLAIVLLPTLGWRFLSPTESHWGPQWHYSAVLMPILFLAAVDGITRMHRSDSTWQQRWAAASPWLIALTCAGIAFLKPTPLLSISEPGLFKPDPKTEQVTAILTKIPQGSIVESDIALMSYLVESHHVYWLGNKNPLPDYVVIGTGTGTPTEWGNALQVAQLLHPDTNFRLITDELEYSLAERIPQSPER